MRCLKYLALFIGVILAACSERHDMYQSLQFSRTLTTLSYTDISWNQLETRRLKAFTETDDRRQTRAARRGLFDDLYKLIGTEAYGEPLKISLYLRPNDIGSETALTLGVFYFDHKLILPVEFQSSENWTSWQGELAGDFDDTVVLHLNRSGVSSTLARLFSRGDPYDNSGHWIVSGAPKEYTQRARQSEKQTYLKPFINTKGASFERANLEVLFRKYITQDDIGLNAPMRDANIFAAFEAATSFAYPAELQVFAAIGDGAPDFTGGYALLSAVQVFTEWKNWKDIYEDWDLRDLTSNNEADNLKTLGIYTNPYWVPFMSDGAGNFIGIDYAPNEQGTSGQIIAFGADAVTVRYLAKDMSEFFALLLNGVDVVNIGLQ